MVANEQVGLSVLGRTGEQEKLEESAVSYGCHLIVET